MFKLIRWTLVTLGALYILNVASSMIKTHEPIAVTLGVFLALVDGYMYRLVFDSILNEEV